MLALTLIIASRLQMFGAVPRDWKYVSPCVISGERLVIAHLERNAPTPKKSGRCKREEQMRQLIQAAINPKE
jgi:hypothetical protein